MPGSARTGPEGRRRAKMVENGRYIHFYKNIDEKSKYTLKNTENSKKMVKNIFSYVKKIFF